MTNRFFLIVFFMHFQLMLRSQSIKSTPTSDSLSFAVAAFISGIDLKYSYVGETYFLVCEQKGGFVKKAYLLSGTAPGDTLMVTEAHAKKIETHLPRSNKSGKVYFILPILFIEDPKRGVNGNLLIYDVAIHKIFSQLHQLTSRLQDAIVLPLETGTRFNIIAN